MVGSAIAAGVAAVAGVTAAVISGNSAKEANKTNKDIMREQQAYQTSERLATQEYNTPLAQRQRFEMAGINPYMALSNIDSGNATAQTAPNSPNMVPEDYSGIATALGQAPQNFLQNQAMLEQINAQKEANFQAHVDSVYKERDKVLELRKKSADIAQKMSSMQKNTAEYQNLNADYHRIQAQAKMADIEYRHHAAFVEARNNKERNMADLIYKQNVGQTLQNAFQEQTNAFLPQLQQAQAQELASAAFAHYQNGVLSHKQGQLTDKQKESEILKAFGYSVDNMIKRGQVTLQQLGINEKQLESMRNGDVISRKQNSPLFNAVDGCLNWVVGLPLQFFK